MEAIFYIALGCLAVLVLAAGVCLYFLEKKTSDEVIEGVIEGELFEPRVKKNKKK